MRQPKDSFEEPIQRPRIDEVTPGGFYVASDGSVWFPGAGRFWDKVVEARHTAEFTQEKHSTVSEVVWRHCARAHEAASEAGVEPRLLVSPDVWQLILGDRELRGDLRFTYPPETEWYGERAVLYGVRIIVSGTAETPSLHRINHARIAAGLDPISPEDARFISEFTGEPYDPEWFVRR